MLQNLIGKISHTACNLKELIFTDELKNLLFVGGRTEEHPESKRMRLEEEGRAMETAHARNLMSLKNNKVEAVVCEGAIKALDPSYSVTRVGVTAEEIAEEMNEYITIDTRNKRTRTKEVPEI